MAIEAMQEIQKPVKGKKTEMVETELGTKISKADRDAWDKSQGESLNEALIPGYAKKKLLASMMISKPQDIQKKPLKNQVKTKLPKAPLKAGKEEDEEEE